MRNAILGAMFLSLGAIYFWTQNQQEPPGLEVPIFDFEKQDLQQVVIHQPNQEVRLVEQDGRWTLIQANNEASTTMVNRSKHQLHHLIARSIVERDPDDLSVYGLAENGIKVDLEIRGEKTASLLIGQANPTGVSYYVMPLSGPHSGSVVTVAKAAVDFFASELSAFRAEHFVQFDLSAVDSVEIVLSAAFAAEKKLSDKQRIWSAKRTTVTDFQYWTGGFTNQSQTRISNDFMRRLLGRYLALKSKGYKGVTEVSDEAAGFDPSNVLVRLSGNGVETTLKIGNQVSDGLRYFSVNGLTDRVIARDGLLEDYAFASSQTRNRKPLDFIQNTDGLKSLTIIYSDAFAGIHGVDTVRLQSDGEMWTFGDRSIHADTATAFLEHLSDCTTLASLEEPSSVVDFVGAVETPITHIEVLHNLQSITMNFGAVVERNMAMSDTDPPQIVQYRQVRFTLEGAPAETVFVEEHWLQNLFTNHSQFEQTSPQEKK